MWTRTETVMNEVIVRGEASAELAGVWRNRASSRDSVHAAVVGAPSTNGRRGALWQPPRGSGCLAAAPTPTRTSPRAAPVVSAHAAEPPNATEQRRSYSAANCRRGRSPGSNEHDAEARLHGEDIDMKWAHSESQSGVPHVDVATASGQPQGAEEPAHRVTMSSHS